MNRFERIRVQGFRRLHNVDLNLGPLNVLIGANGGGKTSLLEAFTLLAASASGNVKQTLSDYGGVEANLTALDAVEGGKVGSMRFDLATETSASTGRRLSYDIRFRARGVSYEIAEENLILLRGPSRKSSHIRSLLHDVRYFNPAENKVVSPEWEYDHQESALSQVPRMYQEPEEFRRELASSLHYHVLDVSWRSPIRSPQPMREAKHPGTEGEDLVSCLYWLREAARDRYERIEDTLRAGFPSFERLSFPPVAAGMLAMTWKETTSKHPYYTHQLSEGTLRFLWLVTLLQSPALPAVTLIDEPEVSLHPELLSLLADTMREAAQRTQLIVATHSDRFVRFLDPSEVIAFDIGEAGAATAKRADEFDLEEWLKEYTLDEVWAMGRIGGRQ